MKPTLTRSLAFGIVAILFVGAFVWVIATQGPLAPVKVTVARATQTTLEQSLFGIATVEARRAHAIGPTTAGRVARVLVDQGDAVVAGQLLAEMEPLDFDARQVASVAAAARAADLVRAAEATLAEATSRATLAQTSAERHADLRRKNFVSQEAADAKAHEAAAGHASRQAAAAALAAAKEEAHRARADVDAAAKNRANLRLVSPVNGIVSARLLEAGSTVVAGQAVVQVIDPATLWLRVRIDQGRATGLAVGLPAEIVLRSRRGEVVPGHVARVDLVGDAVTEERIANVDFEQPPTALAIGELAEVTLRLPPLEKVLAIPAAALVRQGEHQGVWRADGGSARFVPVTPGVMSATGMVEIRAGLAPGDEVIVHSARALTTGSRTRMVEAIR